ncbi:class I SAM-dependent methyltransferase [Clostridium neuense]|uniref:Class I SAM-dependent methyltransferase n=1 Tax=Clostridium neuense TaxID=1728934 RepID=A0ABW8TDM1_9CLOT
MSSDNFNNVVTIAKDICEKIVKPGDTAVDCTAGHGNDTAFLASLVGEGGKVYAFDIQKEAIESTRKKLEENNFLKRVNLINDGHEKIDEYINEKVKLFIFNLGYLPKLSHEITTKANTTLEAVVKCMDVLQTNGVIVINIYYGHENGKKEKEVLEEFCQKINQKEFNVFRLSFMNQANNPPELICIERRN